MHKRKFNTRRVKFTDRDASGSLYGGRKKPALTPLKYSPAPPSNDKVVFSSSANTSSYDDAIEERRPATEGGTGYKAKDSAGTSDRWPPEFTRDTRYSLALPRDQKPSFHTSSFKRSSVVSSQNAATTLTGKRSSVTSTQGTTMGASSIKRPSQTIEESFSGITFSQASTDDLVTNLTKLKLNMQLKGVTDRITEVLDDYDKHTEKNRHHYYDAMGGLDEIDDISLKTKILMLIGDYSDTCTEREKILHSLYQWFSAEHTIHFMKLFDEARSLSEQLLDTYQSASKSQSQDTISKAEPEEHAGSSNIADQGEQWPAEGDREDRETSEVSSTTQRQPRPQDLAAESQSSSRSTSRSGLRSLVSLSVIRKKVSEKLGKSVRDIELAWSDASDNMYELLQWARSEGVADLVTINNFTETLADHQEVFKAMKDELVEQKHRTVMTDMTIVRLTEKNEALEKSANQHDDQIFEAQRTIKNLQKQVKDGHDIVMKDQGTQTGYEIDEVSKEFLQLLLNTSDAKVFDLTEALNASEKERTELRAALDALHREYETATRLFNKDLSIYKDEVNRLMDSIMHVDNESGNSLAGTDSSMLSVTKPATQSTSAPAHPSQARDVLDFSRDSDHIHSISLPELSEPKEEITTDAEGTQQPGQLPLVVEPKRAASPQTLMPPEKAGGSVTDRTRSMDLASIKSISTLSESLKAVSGDGTGSLSSDDSATEDASKKDLKRKLKASVVDNAKMKFDLMERERLLKIAEQEIEDLKARLGAAYYGQAQSPSPTSDRTTVDHQRRVARPPVISTITKILQPGKKLTESNIEKLLASNSDRLNVKLVKELVNQLSVKKTAMDDAKSRSRVVTDLKNVCNIVVHLKKKLSLSDELSLPSQERPGSPRSASKQHEKTESAAVKIKLTGSSDVSLAISGDEEEVKVQAEGSADGTKLGGLEAKPESGRQIPGDEERESGGEKAVNFDLIHKIAEISKAGTQELDYVGSEFLFEIESELHNACDALLNVVTKAETDDEDAEQVLLRGALTERGTAYRSRRRSSCPEGSQQEPTKQPPRKRSGKGGQRGSRYQSKKRRTSEPEYTPVTLSSRRTTSERDGLLSPVSNPGPTEYSRPSKRRHFDARKDLAQFREFYIQRRAREYGQISPVVGVYHLDEDSQKAAAHADEDQYSKYSASQDGDEPVVLRGNSLSIEPLLEDGYQFSQDIVHDQAGKREIDLYMSSLQRRSQQKPREVMREVIKGAGLSFGLYTYNKDAHRKRSLQMYSAGSRTQSRVQSPDIDTEKLSTRVGEGSSVIHQDLTEVTGSQAKGFVAMRPSSEAGGFIDDRNVLQYPLVMEKCLLPSLLDESETKKKKATKVPVPDKPVFKHTISVSGSNISAPPDALGFSRRSGKFRTSISGPGSTAAPNDALPPGPWRDITEMFDPSSVEGSFLSGTSIPSYKPRSRSYPSSTRSVSDSRPSSSLNIRPLSTGHSIPFSIPGSRTTSYASTTVPELRIIGAGEEKHEENF